MAIFGLNFSNKNITPKSLAITAFVTFCLSTAVAIMAARISLWLGQFGYITRDLIYVPAVVISGISLVTLVLMVIISILNKS